MWVRDIKVKANPSDVARASRLPRLRDEHPFGPLRAGFARALLHPRLRLRRTAFAEG
jgi:hypothetical protein